MKSTSSTKTILLILGIFAFMLLLNILMPLHRDDYNYSLIWSTSQHIQSFSDVCQSLVNHYLLHGGRMVTVFFLDLFLWLGKIWFDIANAAVFTSLVLLLSCHAKRSLAIGKETGLLAITAFFMWLCLPHFGEVAVWKSGSTVYLWSGLCIALFLLPYNLSLLEKRPVQKRYYALIPMFFLGILSGWSVENAAVTTVFLTLGLSFYTYQKGKFAPWMLSGAIGSLLGLIGLVGAPGNFVRYDQQGTGKGILTHIGNQFAGNGEMLLYILPIVLLMLLCWYVLKRNLCKTQGMTIDRVPWHFSKGQGIVLVFIAILITSYFTGSWFSSFLRDGIIQGILTPLHLVKPKTIAHFTNVMNGFEEMVIYLLGVYFLYSLLKHALGFNKKVIKQLRCIKAKEVFLAYPAVRYAACLYALALFNNFVMIAAPTFPARATFSSVCMIIIGTLAILRIPEIRQALTLGTPAKVWQYGTAVICLFTMLSTVLISYTLLQEDTIRIAYIAQHAGSKDYVTLPPIALKNRALRHVFYVDFDNGVTRDGVNQYFDINDIKIDPNATLK